MSVFSGLRLTGWRCGTVVGVLFAGSVWWGLWSSGSECGVVGEFDVIWVVVSGFAWWVNAVEGLVDELELMSGVVIDPGDSVA